MYLFRKKCSHFTVTKLSRNPSDWCTRLKPRFCVGLYNFRSKNRRVWYIFSELRARCVNKGVQRQSVLYCCAKLVEIANRQQILIKPNIAKFDRNICSGFRVLVCEQTDMAQHKGANLQTFVTNAPKKNKREKERRQEGEEVRHGNGKLWRKVRSGNTQMEQQNHKVKKKKKLWKLV